MKRRKTRGKRTRFRMGVALGIGGGRGPGGRGPPRNPTGGSGTGQSSPPRRRYGRIVLRRIKCGKSGRQRSEALVEQCPISLRRADLPRRAKGTGSVMVRAEQHRHIAPFLRAVRNEFAVVDREEAHVIAQTRIGLQRKKLVRRDGAKRFERRSACQVYEFLADRLGALA